MRAALLDADGVFQRIDDVAELTPLHLPQITQCDLPPGKYRWVPDPLVPTGGAFWPVKFLNRVEQDKLDVKAAQEAAQKMAERRAQRKKDRGE
jgi:hypothetical protein